ncbi:MAG: hypothetical protein ACRDE5_10715 [Ginsengibacter sp.]
MKSAFIYLIGLILALGCTKDNNNKETADVFPDKPGDMWIYNVVDTLVNGSSYSVSQYYMNVNITGSVVLPGDITATVWVYNYNNNTDTNYVYQNGDTIKFLDKTKSSLVRQYIIPIRLNNSWQYVPGISDVTIIEQGNIIVNGNSFTNAFHLNGNAGMPDAIFGIDEWIENNVGIVKRYINPFGELIITKHYTSWSLVSYHIN